MLITIQIRPHLDNPGDFKCQYTHKDREKTIHFLKKKLQLFTFTFSISFLTVCVAFYFNRGT